MTRFLKNVLGMLLELARDLILFGIYGAITGLAIKYWVGKPDTFDLSAALGWAFIGWVLMCWYEFGVMIGRFGRSIILWLRYRSANRAGLVEYEQIGERCQKAVPPPPAGSSR